MFFLIISGSSPTWFTGLWNSFSSNYFRCSHSSWVCFLDDVTSWYSSKVGPGLLFIFLIYYFLLFFIFCFFFKRISKKWRWWSQTQAAWTTLFGGTFDIHSDTRTVTLSHTLAGLMTTVEKSLVLPIPEWFSCLFYFILNFILFNLFIDLIRFWCAMRWLRSTPKLKRLFVEIAFLRSYFWLFFFLYFINTLFYFDSGVIVHDLGENMKGGLVCYLLLLLLILMY